MSPSTVLLAFLPLLLHLTLAAVAFPYSGTTFNLSLTNSSSSSSYNLSRPLSRSGSNSESTAAHWQDLTQCGGPYNLTAFSSPTSLPLEWSDDVNDYLYLPCGTLNLPASPCDSYYNSLCVYNRYSRSYDSIPYIPEGVDYYPALGGEMMLTTIFGAMASMTTRFLCAAPPRPTIFTTMEIKYLPFRSMYDVRVYTPLMCPSPSLPATCQWGAYNLTPLMMLGDLIYEDEDRDYVYSLAVCGVVSDPLCLQFETNEAAMLCQRTDTFPILTAVLGAYVPQLVTWTALTNESSGIGVQWDMQDGNSCGWGYDRFLRRLTVTFLCDRSVPTYRWDSVTEPEVCWYVATIYTVAACPTNFSSTAAPFSLPSSSSTSAPLPPVTTSISLPATSVSSSTGGGGGCAQPVCSSSLNVGATVGIAIGSVFAVALLILLFLVCLLPRLKKFTGASQSAELSASPYQSMNSDRDMMVHSRRP